MLDQLKALPPDPLLGLGIAFNHDARPEKINLGVGVYQDTLGHTPVMAAVRQAEKELIAEQDSKTYLPQEGFGPFNAALTELVLGSDHPRLQSGGISTISAVGGSGALRLAAGVVLCANPDTTLWLSTPSWPNHLPLLQKAGMSVRSYPYYDPQSKAIDFDAMLNALQHARAGDVLLLHGCCHNPTGVDLEFEHWQVLTELAERKGLLPLVDLAYLGLGNGIEEDARGLRYMAEHAAEMVIANSCSKNFGLYRERTGTTTFLCKSDGDAEIVASQAKTVARQIYSMPPSHGALIAAKILEQTNLRKLWSKEVTAMRERVQNTRALLAQKIANSALSMDASFLVRQNGLFSLLGIDESVIAEMREKYSIYIAPSSRINLAGFNDSNLDYFVSALLACQQSK